MQAPLVSIVINNYNYAEFLGRAIESALDQSYAPIEVVVVDDGSTDRSRQVIAGFGSNIVPVLKENGGQASAFNAGVSCSRGDIICLLDADDLFYHDKVKEIASVFASTGDASKPLFVSHWLQVVDSNGVPSDRRMGGMGKSPLNLYAYAKRYKFTYAPCGPTTGMSTRNSWPGFGPLASTPERGAARKVRWASRPSMASVPSNCKPASFNATST